MSVSGANLHPLSSSVIEATPKSTPSAADSVADQKLRKAAGDFESILLSSLWKSMKQSFASPEDDSSADPAKSTLDDWGIEIMSGAVGRAGGLGIGAMIVKQLEPALRPEAGAASGELGGTQKRISGEKGEATVPGSPAL